MSARDSLGPYQCVTQPCPGPQEAAWRELQAERAQLHGQLQQEREELLARIEAEKEELSEEIAALQQERDEGLLLAESEKQQVCGPGRPLGLSYLCPAHPTQQECRKQPVPSQASALTCKDRTAGA